MLFRTWLLAALPSRLIIHFDNLIGGFRFLGELALGSFRDIFGDKVGEVFIR